MPRLGHRTLALALAAAAGLSGCHSRTPACPPGFAPDEVRTARVLEILRADAEARDLLPEKGLAGACYASQGEGQVAPGPVLLLSSADDDPALAARAAHLLLHEREGAVRSVEAGECGPDALGRLRASEERAWALEARVRARLGLPPRPAELERIVREYEARCRDLAGKGEAR